MQEQQQGQARARARAQARARARNERWEEREERMIKLGRCGGRMDKSKTQSMDMERRGPRAASAYRRRFLSNQSIHF